MFNSSERSETWLYSQTDVHQLIQFRAAALIQVSAAHVALVHQVSQSLYGFSSLRVAHALKAQDPRSFTVHMLGSLVQLEMRHLEREEAQMYCYVY